MISITIRYNGGRKNKNQFKRFYQNTIKYHQRRQEGVTMLICAAVGSNLLRRNKIKNKREKKRRERERERERERAKSFYWDNKRLI